MESWKSERQGRRAFGEGGLEAHRAQEWSKSRDEVTGEESLRGGLGGTGVIMRWDVW